MSEKKYPGLTEAIVTAIAVALAIALCLGYFNQAVKEKQDDPAPKVSTSTSSRR